MLPIAAVSWCSWCNGKIAVNQIWCQRRKPRSNARNSCPSSMKNDWPGIKVHQMRPKFHRPSNADTKIRWSSKLKKQWMCCNKKRFSNKTTNKENDNSLHLSYLSQMKINLFFTLIKKKNLFREKKSSYENKWKKNKKKEFFERIFNFFNEVNFIGLLILISYWKKKEQKIIVLSALWLANKNVDFKMKLNKTNISVPIATHLNINACPSKWSKHLSGKKT